MKFKIGDSVRLIKTSSRKLDPFKNKFGVIKHIDTGENKIYVQWIVDESDPYFNQFKCIDTFYGYFSEDLRY